MIARLLVVLALLLAFPAFAQNSAYLPPPPGQLNLIAKGNGQSSALVLPAALSVFSSVPVGSGAIPPSTPGTFTVVNNDPTNSLLLYPPSGDQITGYSVNAPISVGAGQQATLTWFGNSLSPAPRQWIPSFAGTYTGAANASAYQIGGVNVLAANNALANLMLGYQAGISQTTGNENFFAGYQAGKNVTTAHDMILIGKEAGLNISTCSSNSFDVAVGAYALHEDSGCENTAIGGEVLRNNTTGIFNVGLGNDALESVTTGSDNMGIGHGSCGTDFTQGAVTGSGNTCIGSGAGAYIVGAIADSVFIGKNSGKGDPTAHVTGSENTGIGGAALNFIGSGTYNTAVGSQAMTGTISAPLTGGSNTAVGGLSGPSIQGAAANNALFGYQSGFSITTGAANTVFGTAAGLAITTGGNNTVIGRLVGLSTLATGNNNILIGTSNGCDTPLAATSNYLAICGNSAAVISTTGTDVAGTSATTVAGSLAAGGELSAGTTFTVTGCSASSPSGGADAGSFLSGSTATCTFVITIKGATGLTAPHGWACAASDITTGTTMAQSATSTTTCSVKGATTSGDTVVFLAKGY